MPDPLITVLTVNYNTSDFIELMLYALSKLTANPYKVIICDNGSKKRDILKLARIAKKNNNIELIFRQQSEAGSKAHGEALDILISMVSSKYTTILDSDCTFLLKGWDEKLIKKIDDKVKIIGSGFHSVDKEKRASGEEFPLPFASLFETKVYKTLAISCMPENVPNKKDTCWQWQHKFISGGYNGLTLTGLNTRYFKKGRFASVLVATEYYTPDGSLIASHFGRGSNSGAAKYFKWLKIPVVSGFLKRCYGKFEKKKWISKCYEIINEQL